MPSARFTIWMFAVGLMVLGASVASSQDYPNKPIRIATSTAGGGLDFLARIVARGISGPLGQPVIVDNRPSFVGIELAAKAPPDGYTLIVYGNNIWLAPLLQKVSWDPMQDFSPVTLLEASPNALVVHPSVAAKSVKELVALAKARPGELNYASGPIGGGAHLGAELFKSMAGVNVVRIPYKSGGEALTALLGGNVQVQFAGAAQVTAHHKSGRLNALAVTSSEPSTLFPGLPTVAATVPGYEAVSLTVLLAPAKTPAVIIKRLNQEVVRLLTQSDVKEKLFNDGVQAVGSSPEGLAAAMKGDMTRMGKIIKEAGIKVE